MSGDVQPKRRKDKDKKKKKAQPEGSTDDMGSEDPVKQFLIVDDEDGGDLPPGGDSSHEVHDDHHGHGSASMCGRIVFLTLFVALLVGVFAVFCESWGKSNTEVSIKESRFAELFRGFVEDVDEHEHEDDHLPHASHDDDEEEGEEESSHQPWQEEVRSAQQTRSATTDPPVPEPEVEPSTILAGVTESRLAADAKTHFDGLRTEPLDASSSMGMKSVVESSEKKVEPEAVQGQATELLKTVQVELSSSTLGRDVPSYLTLETSGEIHAEDDDSLLSYLSSSSVPPEPVDEPLFTQSTWPLSGTEPEVLESVEKLPEEQVDDQPVEQVNEQQSDEGYESDRESPPEHPDVHFEQSDEVIEKHVPTVQAPPVIEISEAVDEVEHVEEPKPVVEEPEIEHVEQVEFDKPEPHQEAKNVEDPAVSVVEHRVIEPKEVPEKHVEPLEHIEIEHVSVEEPQIVDNVLPQVEENVVEHEPVLQDLNEVPARSVEASVEEEKSPVHSPEPERVVIEPELDQHAQVEERTEVPSLEPEPLVEEPEIEPRESPWDRYEFRDITNEDDFEVREELDELDRLYAQDELYQDH
ncbi:unnamed protein product [Notodromas monacha]|uniref:Uncharacterized protein n=1 Tax=Notodromas monacha TaxID=399045 RepID=A0A7R9BGK0_9CRUS|nr:unnamed protein product [Notodromas monacha]CAG0914354.1 unnamed protein product [Notodromas monacha]